MMKKDEVDRYMEKNPELFTTIFKELMRLFFELSIDWTIDDIKEFSTNLVNRHLNIKFKNPSELNLYLLSLTSYNEIQRTSLLDEISTMKNYLYAINEKYFFIHLKEIFPNIYNKIIELEENEKAIFNPNQVNLQITQREFAKIVKNNGYNDRFLIFLPKFLLRDKKINENSFKSELSKHQID